MKKKIFYNDPQNGKFIQKNGKDIEATILCELMFEMWLTKQDDDDKVVIILLRNKYKPEKIREICKLSMYKYYKKKRRLKKSLKEWFAK